jgi:hypothetical protein
MAQPSRALVGALVSISAYLALTGTSYGQGGTTSTLAGLVVDTARWCQAPRSSSSTTQPV